MLRLTLAFMLCLLAIPGVIADDAQPAAPTPSPTTPPTVLPTEKRLTEMPLAMTSFGAAVQGGYLYVIGGHTGAAHEYDRDGFNRNFYRLNLIDRAGWEILPGGVPLQSVALVSDSERLYRIGGMTALNAPGEEDELQSTREVSAYDPLTREWTALPELPEDRSSHDAVVHDGKLYVFGGWKVAQDALESDADEGSWHNSGLVLDPKAEKPEWKVVPQPFKTRALALASNGKQIYAIGGMSEKGITRKVHLFDPSENTWSEGPDLSGFAFGTSAYGQDGRVFATNWEGTLFSHAPGEEAWRADTTLTIPRFFHRLIGVGNGEFAAIAGVARGGQIRSIEWLKPDTKAPSITRVTLPAPGNAKTRQGIFFYNNALYVFGGNTSVKDHQFGRDDFSDEAFRISLTSLTAERIAKLPVQRQSFLTFTRGTEDRYSDKVGYAVGGFGYGAGDKAVSHADILEYSLEADVWDTSRVKLPSPLTQFGVAHHEGRIYLFGGLDFDESRGRKERFRESDTIWMWDPKAEGQPTFNALEPKLPTKRRAFGGAQLDGKFYIVGGMTANFEEVDRCDVFDFATSKWTTIPAPAKSRLAPKLVPLNGKLYLVGGSSINEEGSFVTDRTIEVYDPSVGEWQTLISDIGEDLGEMQAIALQHRLLIYSAHNSGQQIKLLFIEP